MTFLAPFRQWLFRLKPDDRLPVILTQRRIFILPTRTGLLFGLVLCLMLTGAINYNLSLGHALIFLLAGLGFVAMVHTFRNLIGLQLLPGRAEPLFAGETAQFQLILENPYRYDRRSLEFRFDANQDLAAENTTLHLPASGLATITIPCATATRGRFDPGRITLSTRYPLGLFRAWSYPHPRLSCLIYPKPLATPLPASFSATQSGQWQGHSGQEDFSGLRLHQPNDSPRHIAWKAVARDIDNRPLLIKQFAGGAAEQLMLDWTQTPAENDIETRLSILCGWVLAAEQQHLHYGLNLPGTLIEPALGATHRQACLEALALYG
ncbi:MAG: DUF58 domain-containing protein [Betaproteobacteria bacterium]